MQQYTTEQQHLAQLSKAMGHPARMALLEYLSGHQSCYFGEICSAFELAKATISQHLTELKSCGLVVSKNEGTRVLYSIDRENWRQARLTYTEFFANVSRERGVI